jgi:hypothetical protein
MGTIYFYATPNEKLISCFCFYLLTERIKGTYEKPRYDGWYNNLAHPDWGSVGKLTIWIFFIFMARLIPTVTFGDH